MSEPVFDPYLVPGTDLLRNLAGARTQRELAEIKHSLATARVLELMDVIPALAESNCFRLHRVNVLQRN